MRKFFCSRCGSELVRDRIGRYDQETGRAMWILSCPVARDSWFIRTFGEHENQSRWDSGELVMKI